VWARLLGSLGAGLGSAVLLAGPETMIGHPMRVALVVAGIVAGLAACAPLAAQQAQRLNLLGPSASLSPPRRVAPLASVADSIRRKTGYQHWKGAAIGGIAGALGGLGLALAAHDQCADCSSDTAPIGKVTLIGAGLGSALGFLVGLASPRYRWVAVEAE
jgi:hypothetical protein